MIPVVDVETAVELLKQGEVIAYPTEAVFGLGCDPDNEATIEKLLRIKKRDQKKGLILVASQHQQLDAYVNFDNNQWPEEILSSWPAAVTWLVPAKNYPTLLTGDFSTQAVRIPNHPIVKQMCEQFKKPIISTSANVSNIPPCKTINELQKTFEGTIAAIVAGELGGNNNPSKIIDYATGKTIRSN